MLRNNVAATLTYFYPVGNTPAVCLIQNLPPEQDADILLLGCGDARNILFTTYSQRVPRRLDITCCDVEPAILARNILLFSLLLDNGYQANLDNIWNIYYHWKIDKASEALLNSKTLRLTKLSTSLNVWHASQLGKKFRFCDSSTLIEVRAVWQHWLRLPETSANEEDYDFNLKHCELARDEHLGKDGTAIPLGILRSAAPLSMEAIKGIKTLRPGYWKDGGLFKDTKSGDKAVVINRTFFATGSRRATLHYGTDPLLGFHLATAYAQLTADSSWKNEETASASRIFQTAKLEFGAWAESFRQAVSHGLTIRLFTGDALAFGHTLQYVGEHPGHVTANLKVHAWTFQLLTLDSGDYLKVGDAPTLFDIVDTSNLADHLGSLNVLTATSSLLKSGMQSTLFTEMLVQHDTDVKSRNDDLLCGNFATTSFLLGLTVVESWTDATLISDADEGIYDTLLKATRMDGNDRNGQVQTRQCWKHLSNLNDCKPSLDAPSLSTFLIRVFHTMFAHEEPMSMASLSLGSLQKSSNPYYTRLGFAAFLKLVQHNIDTDWKAFFELLIEGCQEGSTFSTAMNYIQEVFVSLLQLNLHAVEVLTMPPERVRPLSNDRRLKEWGPLPPLVCVTVQVPRSRLNFMTELPLNQRGIPSFYLTFESPAIPPFDWSDRYGAVQVGFGELVTNIDEVCCLVVEDASGIHGTSDLLVSTFLPTWTLFKDGGNFDVGVGIQNSPMSCATYFRFLGGKMRIFDTTLRDMKRVRVSAVLPERVSATPPTSASAGPARPQVEDVAHHLPILSSRSGRPSNEAGVRGIHSQSLTAELDKGTGEVVLLTSRLNVAGQHREMLAVRSTSVERSALSVFEVAVRIGSCPELVARFPRGVMGKDSRCRIARKSSYVELVAIPLLLTEQLKMPDLMLPMSTTHQRIIPWNAPFVNIDMLPQLDISDKNKLQWLNPHVSMMMSDRERALRDANMPLASFSTQDVRVDFKESIHSIFNIASGLQSAKHSVFGLNKPGDGGNHILFLVSSFKIDQASRTVVIDAAAIPLTHTNVRDPLMQKFFATTLGYGVRETKVSTEELTLWRHVLPALAERCRTWQHEPATCEYIAAGRVPPPDRLADGTSCFCSCGQGKFPAGYKLDVKLPQADAVIRKYGTRVAISPVFAVPYIEECFGLPGEPRADARPSVHGGTRPGDCSVC